MHLVFVAERSTELSESSIFRLTGRKRKERVEEGEISRVWTRVVSDKLTAALFASRIFALVQP